MYRRVVIAELIRRWLQERRHQRLRAQVIEGCRKMADVMMEIEREFNLLDEELDRALDRTPKTQEGLIKF